MIVKVQLSQFPKGRLLIYDKERSFVFEGDATQDVLDIMGARQKIYCLAQINGKNELDIYAETEEQEW